MAPRKNAEAKPVSLASIRDLCALPPATAAREIALRGQRLIGRLRRVGWRGSDQDLDDAILVLRQKLSDTDRMRKEGAFALRVGFAAMPGMPVLVGSFAVAVGVGAAGVFVCGVLGLGAGIAICTYANRAKTEAEDSAGIVHSVLSDLKAAFEAQASSVEHEDDAKQGWAAESQVKPDELAGTTNELTESQKHRLEELRREVYGDAPVERNPGIKQASLPPRPPKQQLSFRYVSETAPVRARVEAQPGHAKPVEPPEPCENGLPPKQSLGRPPEPTES